ncbi:MAG: hypothetical protein ACK4UT_03645 [Moraxellaceae bacterium]
MRRSGLFILLACTALSLGFNPVLAAAEPEKRPRLEEYPSTTAWLQALQAYDRRREPALATATPAKETPATSPLPLPLPEGMDPASEAAPPPLLITGPEDLERAVELARDIHHPEYEQPIRYNRTTHLSFPLRTIESQDMSQAGIGNTLDSVIGAGGSLLEDFIPLDKQGEAPAGLAAGSAQTGPVAPLQNSQSPVNIRVEVR